MGTNISIFNLQQLHYFCRCFIEGLDIWTRGWKLVFESLTSIDKHPKIIMILNYFTYEINHIWDLVIDST